MRLASLTIHDRPILAALREGAYVDLTAADPSLGDGKTDGLPAGESSNPCKSLGKSAMVASGVP